jgi:hypothetical protein
MFTHIKTLAAFLLVTFSVILISCDTEDPGPLQETRKDFSIVDFDRLEMGSAFNIEVEHDNIFSIQAKGDRRNINDLEVYKSGNTLIIEFDDNDDRRHDTYIKITMPRLDAVNFSGGSVSKIRDFESDGDLDLYLSGASVSQLDSDYRKLNLVVSGASSLLMHGSGDELVAEISGASTIKAFEYPVRKATANLSGASEGKIMATDELNVTAAGASSVLYRGNPTLTSNTSGASTVQKD